MTDERKNAGAGTSIRTEFWDALAPHHAPVENSYLNVSATRRIMGHLRAPVLVVGAGHGLIMAEIRKAGLRCDGIDFSSEMIRHAKVRRGIDIIHADARAMPIPDQTYETVIFATGVVDFTEDETAIRMMLKEGRRVVRESGKVFVAFYRLSAASERFLSTIGLLKGNIFTPRPIFEMRRLNPFQRVSWVAKKAGLSYLSAAFLLLRTFVLTTIAERRSPLRLWKIVRKIADSKLLIETAPERQPYRNQAAVRNLFERLAIQVKQLDVFASCYIARIQ
jgi:ubiquinone/menaquinone biosynthesis C-methylase UbiE